MLPNSKWCLVQSICFIILLQGNNVNTKTSSLFVGTVENITVEAIEYEKHFEINNIHSSLKLNISWLPPVGMRNPSSYSVIVTSFQRKEGTNVTECPEGSLYYTSQNEKQTTVLLPQSNLISEIPEMHIYPNCSYKIEVFANPRLKPTEEASKLIYTVPECVGSKCSCTDAKSVLPIPKVYAIQHKNNIFINWTINSNLNVDSYAVSVGTPLLISKAGFPVYNITKLGLVKGQKLNYLWNLTNDENNVMSRIDYKIAVVAVDKHGCSGVEGTFFVHCAQEDVSVSKNIFWLILGAIITLCVIFGAAYFISCHYNKNYELIWNSKTTRIEISKRKLKSKSHWAESVLQKHNILYVEQEFEDVFCKMKLDKHKVPYNNVTIIQELGKGQFGRVYLGNLNDDKNTLVAVKMSQCTDISDMSEIRQQFIEEIEIMKAAGSHPHLVKLIGYSTQPDKPICIILEYMPGGDLLAYLHSQRNNRTSKISCNNGSTSETLCTIINSQISSNSVCATSHKLVVPYKKKTTPTTEFKTSNPRYVNIDERKENEESLIVREEIERKQFIKFALDIGKGMEHLEAKCITHRDLAARNILLTSDLTLKISDFGLSRNGIYIMNNAPGKVRQLPIRWMSPEAIRDRAFSSKSDVWSFAIVLWEIATLGAFPYPDIQDEYLLHYILQDGGRLDQPSTLFYDIYELMCLCWTSKPENRPSFSQIVQNLQTLSDSQSTSGTSNPCYSFLP